MPTPEFRDPRLTEQRNPRTVDIDIASTLAIADLINAEDRLVPAAVQEARAPIAATIDLAVRAFRAGGRLIYVGAGTSGRLGVLDASECPPTFGTPPELVIGVIAGGREALVMSEEGTEDDADAGARAMDDHRVGDQDLVVGIAASGTTPYVGAALERAHAVGAATVLLTCADPPEGLRAICDQLIVLKVGPEAVTGSTRMKAGTATKLALNTVTTGAMIRLGKTFGNLMVDLEARSDKLHDRGERIVMEVCAVDRATARRAIDAAAGSVKLAIVMLRRSVNAAEARRLLEQAGGLIRRVIGDPPPVVP
jgi:N-acetylmuramic acid 6-phosphate etherase